MFEVTLLSPARGGGSVTISYDWVILPLQPKKSMTSDLNVKVRSHLGHNVFFSPTNRLKKKAERCGPRAHVSFIGIIGVILREFFSTDFKYVRIIQIDAIVTT